MTGPKTNEGATKVGERTGTRSTAKYVRSSAYKAREVLDLIRGLDVRRADEVLQFTDREIARAIRKVLASAVANAIHNDEQDPDELYVRACFADEGPTLRRFRPRARGRATRVRKRTCHITILLSPIETVEVTPPPVVEEKPRRPRKAQPQAAEAAPATTEEKPKRARTPKPAAATEAEAPAVAEPPPTGEPEAPAAEEPPAETVAPEGGEAQAEVAQAAAEEPAPEAQAPKPRRTRAKKADAPAPTDEAPSGAAESAAEEKPKPARRRKKPAEESEKES